MYKPDDPNAFPNCPIPPQQVDLSNPENLLHFYAGVALGAWVAAKVVSNEPDLGFPHVEGAMRMSRTAVPQAWDEDTSQRIYDMATRMVREGDRRLERFQL